MRGVTNCCNMVHERVSCSQESTIIHATGLTFWIGSKRLAVLSTRTPSETIFIKPFQAETFPIPTKPYKPLSLTPIPSSRPKKKHPPQPDTTIRWRHVADPVGEPERRTEECQVEGHPSLAAAPETLPPLRRRRPRPRRRPWRARQGAQMAFLMARLRRFVTGDGKAHVKECRGG